MTLKITKDELIAVSLELQALLNRLAKTSDTSSTPPSLDKKARLENARPGGTKPRHKGPFCTLHDDPDETVDHRPDTCPCWQEMSADVTYLPAAQVRRRYGGISDMTLWRWLHDPGLNFPQPLRINSRRFWKLVDLERWERQRDGEAA